jgi:uncharacterized protein (TIGR03118 family)
VNLSWTPVLFILLFLAVISGCKKNEPDPASTAAATDQGTTAQRRHHQDYEPFNLVADTAGYHAMRIDLNLNNAWGIAFGPTGAIWIASNHKGLSVVYDRNGNQLRPPVTIPFQGVPDGGSPTGTVYNNTTGFVIPGNGETSKFIFSAEDGTITAWSSGNSAFTVADRSGSNAVYKGLALAHNGTANYLYATNFKGAQVDVFDQSFNYVTMPFIDPGIPAGYAPFGIQNIDNKLYITYAKQLGPDNQDDDHGPGRGYVSIFNPDGSFVRRFASQGHLNSPWGIAKVPGNQEILVGNFGDGVINVFNTNGNFIRQLKDDNQVIVIEGLWAIAYAPSTITSACGVSRRLYFTAGPDEENHGLFGYIRREH